MTVLSRCIITMMVSARNIIQASAKHTIMTVSVARLMLLNFLNLPNLMKNTVASTIMDITRKPMVVIIMVTMTRMLGRMSSS